MRNVQTRLAGKGQRDCDSCGEPIPRDRRKAMPGAIRCTPCQQTFERLEGLGL
ncbi:MAG: TraR/DksA C4-type zinc finger protein [Pseudomonadota bacterium]